MAVPGSSVRPPSATSHRPSRLPLHRCRPSTDKFSSASPESSSVYHTETSHTSVFSDANKASERLVGGSRRSSHKTTNIGRQRVADETPSCRRPPAQARRRDATGVNSSAAVNGQNHVDVAGFVNDLKHAVRQTGNPTCGVRMSSLLRQQQPSPQSPTSSVKSSTSMASDRRATAARLEAVGGVQPRRAAKPRVSAASSHHASTSSVDSTCWPHRAPDAPTRLVRMSAASALAADDRGDVRDRQRGCSSRNSSASYLRRKSAMSRDVTASESDEILSSRSDCPGRPPTSRPVDQLRRRSDGCQSTSNVYRTRDIVRGSEHQQRPAVADVVEPRRRCYDLRRLSDETDDVDDLSTVDSVSTITSVASSSSSLSSETLTDDELAEESTSAAARQRRRRYDTSAVTSAKLDSSHLPSPLYRARITAGHKTRTKPPSSFASCVSSSELQSPSSTSTEGLVKSAEKYTKGIQRIGNLGRPAHAPATVSKHTVPPPTQNCASPPGAANQPRNRQIPAPASSRYNTPSSPRWLPSGSTTAVAKNAARRDAHSSTVAAVVDRGQQIVFVNGSSATVNTTTVKPPSSPPHCNAQTRQNAAVKKIASAAGVSNSKSSFSHSSVRSSSKVVDEKRIAFQSPQQRAFGTANKAVTASKISSASGDYTRRTGSGGHIRTNIADTDNTDVTDDRRVVDKSVGNLTTGVVASRGSVKPTTSTASQFKSSPSETAPAMDISQSTKTTRDVPTPRTRSSRIQMPATVVTRSTDSNRGNDATAVTTRPPPPPSKLRRPSSISGTTAAADRRNVSATEQKRPASIDFSAISSKYQQPVDVCRKKSDSGSDVTSRSASIEQAVGLTTRKPVNGVLNKNDHLTKSYDSITRRTGNSENQNSDAVYSQLHSSSMSLSDVPPRRLVKPYSVINRCSNFVRRIAALNEDRSTYTDNKAELETENLSAGGRRSSLASRPRARTSELSDLAEVDEFECDRQLQADKLSSGERNRASDDGKQQSTAKRTETVIPSLICPSVTQTPVKRYKTEYSTFLCAVPPQSDAGTSNNSSSHRDSAYIAIKQDKNDLENSCCSEDFRFIGDVEPANERCISLARPDTLSAEMPITEDATATATAEAANKPSPADNYVVTYESDNIVVLDREPVVDFLTPDGDVVSTEVCQLLAVPANSVGAGSGGEAGLLRTLPLSESGYDTWKSSQGSIAVAAAGSGGSCIVAPDHQQRNEEDGTLRDCGRLKTFVSQSAPLSTERNVDSEGRCGTCQAGDDNSLVLFGDGNNLLRASINTELCDFKDDDGRLGESPISGRFPDDSVQDSAQMFVSICSDAADPVSGRASSPGRSCVTDNPACRSSLSPPDNAVSGLADPTDICFSSQTIPSNDSDVLSTFGALTSIAAHLEHSDEEVLSAFSLLPGMDHFRYHEAVEVSAAHDSLAEAVQDETRLYSAVISTKKTADANDVDAGINCVVDSQQLDQHREVFRQLKSPCENSDSDRPSSSSAVTDVVSDSTLLDSYETICDDLLESIETNNSDAETSHSSSSADHAAATDLSLQPDAKSTERSETLHDDHTTVTKAVTVGSRPIHGRISTLNSSGPPLSTTMNGCLPASTLRRVRTNFSVIYQQSSAAGSHVADASTRETLHHRVDQEPGTRKALALLASRLDDHSRRRLVERNVDGCSSQTAAVDHDHDVSAASPACCLSSEVELVDFSSTVVLDYDATAERCGSDLQTAVKSVSAESRLPILMRPSSAHSCTSKKPSTFRRFLSSKLTNAIRRAQTKYD